MRSRASSTTRISWRRRPSPPRQHSMPLILFDHECPTCGHTFEDFINSAQPEPVNCPECQTPAQKLISGTRMDPKLGVDADRFPTMGDKWAKIRVQRQKIEAKKARDHGPG